MTALAFWLALGLTIRWATRRPRRASLRDLDATSIATAFRRGKR